jgi:peroxiredoxin
VQLHRAHERFAEAGAELTLIGQATPRHAAHFHRRLGLEGMRLLADERRRSYKAAGLKVANPVELLGPRSIVAGLRRIASTGVVQGRTIGHPAQLGGALVVRPGGEVAFAHASRHAGDNVQSAALLDAVEVAS